MKLKYPVICAAAMLSCAAFASSPFMVKHNAVENGSGRAATKPAEAKSVTLAESLVHLRQCSDNGHIGQTGDNAPTPAPSSGNATPGVKLKP